MTTKSTVFYPIFSALTAAQSFIETERGHHISPLPTSVSGWNAANEAQANLLSLYPVASPESTTINDIQTKVDTDAEPLNQFMKDHGFVIELAPFPDPTYFGVVSIMNVLVNWLKPGETEKIVSNNVSFKAVSMEDHVTVHSSRNHSHPVAELKTTTGERVYMTIADKSYEGQELLIRIETICENLEASKERWGGVVFPKIDLNQEVDISWLKELNVCVTSGKDLPGGKYVLKEALQQTKFRMNELGARAESAVAISMCFESCMMPRPKVMIDQPFFCWIERDGLSLPLFAGYLDRDSWKDPGSLA